MANKKINQLVSKTAILSTDIFGIGDATTGQLFKKTIAELQAAIGGAVISVNGLVGTVVLDTDDIQELATPTNKYFTDARARGAISLTVTGNSGASTYLSGTGVLNVPTYTLAGLGGITASFLSGTSGISYNSTTGVISYSGTVYTDASIRALFNAGTGISYNSSTGAISYSGTVYTDSSVRALISMTTTGTSGASTYNNTTGVINVPNYTLAGLGGISLTSLSGGTGITYNSSTGAISYSGTVYTDASIRGLFSASGSVSYNNTTGVISLTGGNLTEATSSVLTITGGTGAVIGGGTSIQVKQATTSVSGFLLSTDWTTFNSKQATITLTTTGTSGAATFSANTLNIPNYGSALSGYLPLTGGTLTGALSGTSATFSGAITGTGNAATSPAIIYNNTTGASGTAQYYADFTAGATVIGRILRGNGLSGYEANGLNIDNFAGMQIKLNTLGGSGGSFAVTGGAATFSSSVTAGGVLTSDSATTAALPATSGSTQSGGLRLRLTTNGSSTAVIDYGTAGGSGGWIQAGIKDSLGTTLPLLLNPIGGNVGIGTTTPGYKLHVVGGSEVGSRFIVSGTYAPLQFSGDNSTTIGGINAYGDKVVLGRGTSTGVNTDFVIFSNANTAIGTATDNGYKLYVSGTIYATGNITANSDLTLKKNLELITNPTDKLMQLNGYLYQWKEDDSYQYGVIAQEVEKILPYAVSTGNDGIKGVSYNQIIPVLIEAVKEQKAKIENLEILLASK